MPSTLEIRRRIRSIKSTRQITRAMEMVSAAKMRKAQSAALASRTYAALAWELLQRVSAQSYQGVHRLLRQPEKVETAAIVVITSNRGLIGAFNNNIISRALVEAAKYPAVEFITLGKKGRDAVKKRGQNIAADFPKLDSLAGVAEIAPLARLLVDDFVSGKYDKVILVNMNFVSTLRQELIVSPILPLGSSIVPSPLEGEGGPPSSGSDEGEYLYEPTPDQVLEVLLPRLVTMQVYQALLETNAAEHSARMVAMKNASDAAGDLVSELSLEYNQIRQAGITKEISEIVAGRLALE